MLEGDGGPQLPVQAELLPRTGMFGWVFPGPRGGSLGNNPVTWNVGAFNLEKKKKTQNTYPFYAPEGCENWPSLN